MSHPSLESLLSPEGWVHASADPVAAGDPGRFHALFGRDSLITALQVLPDRPEIAAATLRALAARQGRAEDPETEEQPGRILHEDRPVAPQWLVERGWPVRDGAMRYFGTSDATSWFLVVLDATRDDGAGRRAGDRARRPQPSGWSGPWPRAAGWCGAAADASPAGSPSRAGATRSTPATDEHGGGIVREDGIACPRAPLADADSQAVAVAALDALARLDPERRRRTGPTQGERSSRRRVEDVVRCPT